MTQKIQSALAAPIVDVLFKAAIVLVVPLEIWQVQQIYMMHAFMGRGDRFSSADAHRLELQLREELVQMEKEFSSNFVRWSELNQTK